MPTSLSYGAGVQTTALLVLIATERWHRPDAILFADTEGEHDETYAYLTKVAQPYAHDHDMEIITLGGEWRTKHYRAGLEDYCIDHRMVPGTWLRWCTDRYKVKPIRRYHKKHWPGEIVESWIGISTDEMKRARTEIRDPLERRSYPLLELGLARSDCLSIIKSAGLPTPPKSGCWFCPFKSQAQWFTLRRRRPDLFDRAHAMEKNARGKNGEHKYLAIFGSLDRIAAQDEFPGFDEIMESEAGCVTGQCFV